jgi:hypothetical protein
MTAARQRKQALRHSIKETLKAHKVQVTIVFLLLLIFSTEAELQNLARTLNIKQ